MSVADAEERFVKPVRYFVYLLSLTLWAVIGFVFWIPVLIRATAAFSSMILYCAITGASSQHLGHQLNAAITFYFDGFHRIAEAMFSPSVTLEATPRPFFLRQFVAEVAWAILFWGLAIAWIVDVPVWSRIFGPIGDLLKELFHG